mmetsp:Transcript_78327/g.229552  ORF Transcript_78327/g.229552 Transcript_78327/m.229552 type:complete len:313 (-) Transcript_78327:150-1088(-)
MPSIHVIREDGEEDHGLGPVGRHWHAVEEVHQVGRAILRIGPRLLEEISSQGHEDKATTHKVVQPHGHVRAVERARHQVGAGAQLRLQLLVLALPAHEQPRAVAHEPEVLHGAQRDPVAQQLHRRKVVHAVAADLHQHVPRHQLALRHARASVHLAHKDSGLALPHAQALAVRRALKRLHVGPKRGHRRWLATSLAVEKAPHQAGRHRMALILHTSGHDLLVCHRKHAASGWVHDRPTAVACVDGGVDRERKAWPPAVRVLDHLYAGEDAFGNTEVVTANWEANDLYSGLHIEQFRWAEELRWLNTFEAAAV